MNRDKYQQNMIWTTNIVDTTHIPSVKGPSKEFKPVKAGKKESHVVFILDSSSSMFAVKNGTISGFNEYLQSQRDNEAETGIKTFVSLYTFDGSNVNCEYNYVPVSEAEDLTEETYRPSGMTNLLDAIGFVMDEVNSSLKSDKKKNRPSVIITLLTDGAENMSMTYSNDDIKRFVSMAEEKNWGFMFLGANIDAFAVGSTMGFRKENTMQYDVGSMSKTISYASRMANDMKAGYASGELSGALYAASAFTEEEREDVK